ncbi:MAG: response regulator transcription factor [Firmicutes bacterium]|nr:response regulator transcription factor [Bacillota bacterium]
MTKVLIVDDNKQITQLLSAYVKREGWQAFLAYDGLEAIELFRTEAPDVILLDVMLPGIDGFEVCRQIRKDSQIPIIMVTARGEDFEKIMGLEIGADDYIVKPFSPQEVMARVKAILRRVSPDSNQKSEAVSLGNLKIEPDQFRVTLQGEPVVLTKKEFDLLLTLVYNKNLVLNRDQLLDKVWGYDYYGDTRTVDSHIKRLRAKFEKHPKKGWDIKTIWGVGYKLEENQDEE